MAKEEALRVIYQLHILLLKISPAIWRRVLVPSDQNLADFHDTLQILMGWDDTHLHRFLIHGKAYGVTRDGGLCFSDNPKQARLNNLHLRIKERFLFDFPSGPQSLENLPLFHQVYVGGARQAPPAWCNGPLAYLEQKQYFSVGHIGCRLLEIIEDEEARVGDYQEEAATMLFWLQAETFDRSAVNDRLALFAAGDKRWLETEKVKILLMKMTIQVVIEDEDHQTPPVVKEVISLERNVEDLRASTLGLKLDEAKEILAEIQTALVTAQATHFQERQCSCPECGTPYLKNGTHQLTFRTLFGTIKLASQRFYTCSCQLEKTRQHDEQADQF